MDEIKLLIEGYARQKENGRWEATSAAVLIRSGGKAVLIDPGVKAEELRNALKNEKLGLADIDIVAVTHSHYDHSRNARLFEKGKILDLSALYRKTGPSAAPRLIPGTAIEILITPGHVDKHASFLVETSAGRYAVAGDIFWWEDGQQQKTDLESLIGHPDLLAKNADVLRSSRWELLSRADYIIPGHGKTFRVMR